MTPATETHWDNLHTQHRHQLEYPNEHAVRFLARHRLTNPEARNLLDIGCGAGRHIKLATELGYHAQGVDTSTEAVRQATQRGLTARHGDMRNLPHPDGSFDVALAIGSFYYGTRADMRDAITELDRILNPVTGCAFVTLRTVNDSRHTFRHQPSHKLELPETEKGLTCAFISAEEIPEFFYQFHVTWATVETTYGDNWCDSDYAITARR